MYTMSILIYSYIVSLEVGNQVSTGGGSYETTNMQFRRLYELDSKNQEIAK